MTHNKTYTAAEVARLVGLDLKSVYEGARRGEIPCRRVGRRYLFPVAAIDAWLSGARATIEGDKVAGKDEV